MIIDNTLIDELFAKAEASERKRMNHDLRTSEEDSCQRMLNAMLPGTIVPIHRHPNSNENVVLIKGRMDEVLYEEVMTPDGRTFKEVCRYPLDLASGNYGCVIPANVWHTVEIIEPSVIYEAKDGRFGHDGSERV